MTISAISYLFFSKNIKDYKWEEWRKNDLKRNILIWGKNYHNAEPSIHVFRELCIRYCQFCMNLLIPL